MPSAGVGEILEANVEEEEYLAAAEEAKIERKAIYGFSNLGTVSYTHLRAHETRHDVVCRLLLEKKKFA